VYVLYEVKMGCQGFQQATIKKFSSKYVGGSIQQVSGSFYNPAFLKQARKELRWERSTLIGSETPGMTATAVVCKSATGSMVLGSVQAYHSWSSQLLKTLRAR
jgi:hypothetical protein